ncbi:MAG TPA: superinfection immunity protein [Stellaceae bacterium]|nr:superinfection immunity protein [Stellaceae bacterium]
MFGSTSTILMLLAVIIIYLLPTVIAYGREHPRRQEVLVLNLLLGWTLIGWFVVFLWASLARTEDQAVLP